MFELADDRYEPVPAHKIFLVTFSDVFRVMLNGTWIEKNEVKICDASPSAFKEILQFIYLDFDNGCLNVKGWSLFAKEDIAEKQYVIEYKGEVIDRVKFNLSM